MDNKGNLVSILEKGISSENMAIGQYRNDIQNTRNPYVRQVLKHALSDEHMHDYNFKQALRFFNTRKGDEFTFRDNLAMTFNRIGTSLKSNKAKGIFFGVGIALIGITVAPTLKKVFKPIAVKTVSGVMAISESMKGVAEKTKENIEGVKKEAYKFRDEQISKLKDDSDDVARSIIEELQTQRDDAMKETQDLKTRIEELEKQLDDLKKNK